MEEVDGSTGVPEAAAKVFGDGLDLARRFAGLLERHGVERGLIGPREVDRLWDRHLLNSAVIAEQIPHGARVIDVGSGAGFPGVPLSIARPDLDVVLIEPMARRADWLAEVVDALDLSAQVVRGRAEEKAVREDVPAADVVTSRAVAPLARLAGWCLPLTRQGGVMLALKGSSVRDEITRDLDAVKKAGGATPSVHECGAGLLDTPTTVVKVERTRPVKSGGPRRRAGGTTKSKRAR
ncbi:16S rRNA (guanine(527)-N(7))-methyltransferase RsmG [Amycolatopsis sp. CA-230715]|uniref:16S rRNA (guanine(527)-N(7))-methyltransferase RsmG n=1 Tax=Amycolatopsis sp. CA-230715 TaxID=2745196 RepID=UPI001C036ADF|nr:16S rRNA (guanine(527)-N(7))-methyltransferase RsmG [Amycolatopsis sp. CA-230715]QWF80479.1 Ribosomal RNA small subunit methyltransferase G [Amycolatopsis sp. CA-230715]